MKKFIVRSARYFWLTAAVLIVLAAVAVQLAREFSPALNDNKDWVAARLAKIFNSQVQIGQLEAQWQGLTPSLRVHNLDIFPADALAGSTEPSLVVSEASAQIDVLRSVLQLRTVFTDVTLHDAQVRVQQDKDGSWHLAGIHNTAQGNAPAIDDPMDIFLLADRAKVDNVKLLLRNYFGNEFDFNISSVQFENSDLFHRVSANLTIDNEPILDFVMEAEGDPRAETERDLQAYLKVSDLPVKAIQDLMLSSGWNIRGDELQSSNLGLTAWLTSNRKGYYTISGDLDLKLIGAFIRDNLALPFKVAGNFYSEIQPAKTRQPLLLQFQNLAVAWPDVAMSETNLQLDYTDDAWNIYADRFDLAELTQAFHAVGLEQKLLNSAVDGLNARGGISNIALAIPSADPAGFLLRANLQTVVVDSWRGAPALSNVNGYIETGAKDGHVLLADSDNISVHFPDIFNNALEFNSVKGAVGWQLRPEDNAIYVNSSTLELTRDESDVSGKFRLYLPWKDGSAPMDMSLAVGLTNARADERDQYIPKVLDQGLRDWLSGSIKAGEVPKAGLIYRGRFGGRPQESAVQLWFSVVNGAVDFDPAWPEVSDVTADVVVDNNRVRAQASHARLWDSTTDEATVLVTSQGQQLDLAFQGKVTGPGQDGLRFLKETPLRETFGEVFDEWQVSNQVTGDIAVEVPLSGKTAGGYQRLDITMAPGELQLKGLDLTFTDVAGKLTYDTHTGLTSEPIEGKLWGEKVVARIASPLVPNGEADQQGSPQRDILASFDGDVDIAKLQAWLKSPELRFGRGKAAVSGTLRVPASKEGPVVELDLASDLVGVSMDLPAPLNKGVETPVDFKAHIPLYEDRTEIQLSANDLLMAQINMQGDFVTSVGVGIGNEPNMQPNQIWLTGSLPEGDFFQWLDVIEQYQKYAQEYPANPDAPPLSTVLNLYVESAAANTLAANHLRLLGWQEPQQWRFDVDSDLISAEIILPNDETLPLHADIAYFQLPASEESDSNEDPLADVVLTDLPQMDVKLDEFRIGDEDYGAWQFKLRQREFGVEATDIHGLVRGLSFSGLAAEGDSGGHLTWLDQEGNVSTHFEGRILASDLREVLYLWHQPELLETSKAVFDADIGWSGSPAMINYVNFNGDINVDIEHGRFIEGVEGGGDALLRLVALFNFDSWARRLRLGMADLVDSGLAFDSIDGQFVFEDHQLILPTPLLVKAPSSNLRFAGTFDLQNEQLDSKLVATLPVGGNLTFLAAVAAGLPAAAGIWAVSKIFKKQVNKVASVSYHIHGSWADPQMEFDRLFDSNPIRKSKRSDVEITDPIPEVLEPDGIDSEPIDADAIDNTDALDKPDADAIQKTDAIHETDGKDSEPSATGEPPGDNLNPASAATPENAVGTGKNAGEGGNTGSDDSVKERSDAATESAPTEPDKPPPQLPREVEPASPPQSINQILPENQTDN